MILPGILRRRRSGDLSDAPVRPLGRADRARVLAFLRHEPVRDTFVASRVLHDGLLDRPGPSPLWGGFDGGRLVGVLHLGPNLVPAVLTPSDVDRFARLAVAPGPTRMLVGERRTVERLWSLVGATYPVPRQIRTRQFVYVRTLAGAFPAAPVLGGDGTVRTDVGVQARLATPADEPEVLHASAAMHLEEMGEDPLALDPDGYRHRVRLLIRRGWTFVARWQGRLVFKMDIGCAGTGVAQIQGVYTPPDLRGYGLATAGMAACSVLALRRCAQLSLYVNDYNHRALALYRRLGFVRAPLELQSVLL